MSKQSEEFTKELEALINRFSKENESDTPDYILAAYLEMCLTAFEAATNLRDKWFGHKHWENNTTEIPTPQSKNTQEESKLKKEAEE